VTVLFDIQGTPNQQRLVSEGLAKCDFPFERMRSKLWQDVRRNAIPILWEDLSQWGAQSAQAQAHPSTDHHHDHERNPSPDSTDADPLEVRGRVLGLAWYSGKVSLDLSLESDPPLCDEVNISEIAHMVNFFDPNFPEQAIFDIFHGGSTPEHGHAWFDKGSYWDFVGESFMGGFIYAYAPTVPVTIEFNHPATPEVGRKIRELLTPELVVPETFNFFGVTNSKVFHDSHERIKKDLLWRTYHDAEEAGRRPCKTCKPKHDH
jgi:hypothetical protein